MGPQLTFEFQSEQLSYREKQLCEALGKGMRDKEIAQALGLTPGTVKAYMCRIYRKTHKNRLQLGIEWAIYDSRRA